MATRAFVLALLASAFAAAAFAAPAVDVSVHVTTVTTAAEDITPPRPVEQASTAPVVSVPRPAVVARRVAPRPAAARPVPSRAPIRRVLVPVQHAVRVSAPAPAAVAPRPLVSRPAATHPVAVATHHRVVAPVVRRRGPRHVHSGHVLPAAPAAQPWASLAASAAAGVAAAGGAGVVAALGGLLLLGRLGATRRLPLPLFAAVPAAT